MSCKLSLANQHGGISWTKTMVASLFPLFAIFFSSYNVDIQDDMSKLNLFFNIKHIEKRYNTSNIELIK